MTECGCDFKTGECQGPLGCELRTENERLTKERDLALANADAVYARLMPEIERLRAAGTVLSKLFDDDHMPGPMAYAEGLTYQELRDAMHPFQQSGSEK